MWVSSRGWVDLCTMARISLTASGAVPCRRGRCCEVNGSPLSTAGIWRSRLAFPRGAALPAAVDGARGALHQDLLVGEEVAGGADQGAHRALVVAGLDGVVVGAGQAHAPAAH